jgi:hypothetical protein
MWEKFSRAKTTSAWSARVAGFSSTTIADLAEQVVADGES